MEKCLTLERCRTIRFCKRLALKTATRFQVAAETAVYITRVQRVMRAPRPRVDPLKPPVVQATSVRRSETTHMSKQARVKSHVAESQVCQLDARSALEEIDGSLLFVF